MLEEARPGGFPSPPSDALVWGPQPHLPQEVPAVGPGFAPALELIAKCAGAETVLFLLLTDAAAKGGRRPHVLWVLDPVAPKLGQDNQGVRASLLHNLGQREGLTLRPALALQGEGTGGLQVVYTLHL